MHRASVSAKKALSSANQASALESLQPAMRGLTLSCYKNLLKEATYFDKQPLAKALLSASPFLRKDPCWESLVYPTTSATPKKVSKKVSATSSSASSSSTEEIVRPAHGLTANTLALPTRSNSLQAFVKKEFRNLDRPFNIDRYFACMRRLELAKKLHTSCADEVSPVLPAVTPKLQQSSAIRTSLPCDANSEVNRKSKKVSTKAAASAADSTTSVPGLKPGSMLLAHPVLVDDFTQATVLITTIIPEEGVTGLTLNVPYVPLHMVMASSSSAESTLRQRFPELWSKKIKASNQSFFNDWIVYSGGSIACAPLIVHKSPEIAQGIVDMNNAVNNSSSTTGKSKKAAAKKAKIVDATDAAYAVRLPSGWWVHALSDVMMLDPSLVQNSVEEKHNARIVMNYSGWSEEQLQEEVCQNWWIQTEATSSCRALESLFAPVEVPKKTAVASSSTPALSPIEAELEAARASNKKKAAKAAVVDADSAEDDDIQYGSPSNYMWQRAVANLGGDLKDFSRLKVVEEEEGDYRRMITSTFKDDLPASGSATARGDSASSLLDAKE